MKKLFVRQNNHLIAANTDAAKKMKNDTISHRHDIYGNFPALKPDEDLAFGRLGNFVPEGIVILHNNPSIANDLYEHDC